MVCERYMFIDISCKIVEDINSSSSFVNGINPHDLGADKLKPKSLILEFSFHLVVNHRSVSDWQ